ncbi:MAG: zf-HC2 domain-containing protein [Desulfotomaculaceae bacterium]|nr:zf-HC2 domain-containing protein [Desulfotomaculaceae bacterium]
MRCHEALNLISLHLDGTLAEEQVHALELHMAKCGDCAREMKIQEKLASVLREIGSEEIQAPPQLCSIVMGRLQAERKCAFQWLPVAWRKSVAAAAAILLLAGGSAGVATGLRMAGTDKVPGQGTIATVQTGGGTAPGPGLVVPTTPDNNIVGNENKSDPGDTGTDIGSPGEATTGNAPVDNGLPSPSVTGVPTQTGPVGLLSGGIKVNSTVLRLAVDDIATARAKAVAIAAGANAATQVFPEQRDGKKIMFIRLTVATNQAPDLLANLSRLGSFVDRQDESRDNTSYYNELAVRHSELQAHINTATDSGERRQMEAQAASCKQEMDNMRAEADKRLIMLWLESR